MTTNRIEALDQALLRAGHIDYRLYMGHAAESQRVELYRRFFPEVTEAYAREFAQTHSAETMAEFQGLLLSLKPDWEIPELPDERSHRVDADCVSVGRALVGANVKL